MSETEKNRQVVQDGLNKRKAKRKKAEEEAYQESIEAEMISVVNKHYHNVETQKQMEIDRATMYKAEKLRAKKIADIQEKRDGAVTGVFMSLMLFAVVGICYVTEITEMWNIIAATALTAITFIISACFAVSYAIKLTQEVSHARIIA